MIHVLILQLYECLFVCLLNFLPHLLLYFLLSLFFFLTYLLGLYRIFEPDRIVGQMDYLYSAEYCHDLELEYG